MNKNIVLFGDNKKICQELKSRLSETGITAEIHVLTSRHLDRIIPEAIPAAKGKQIVLVFKNENLKTLTEIFNKTGITDLFVCPWDTHYIDKDIVELNSCIIPVDNTKPRLNHIEIELCDGCNLNCKGCFQFSNLVEGKNPADYNAFVNDLKQLKDFFWGIGKIRLLGGEPLLNSNFLMFVKAAREIFPDSDIRLVSNGLLIPSLNKDDLAELKHCNCIFDISNYPPTQKIIDSITGCLKEAGVLYTVSLPINIFFKSLLSKPLESPDTSFNNCIFTHCHALAAGRLAACTHQFYINRLNTAFDLNFPADEPDEVIDIYNTLLNGWEINKIFDNPRDFCRYCSTGMVPVKWKTVSRNKVNANDWIVKNTFINVKVLPFLQKTMKSFETRLRHFVQQPKIR